MGLVLHYVQHPVHTLTVVEGSEINGIVDLATIEWVILAFDFVYARNGAFAFGDGGCWFCLL